MKHIQLLPIGYILSIILYVCIYICFIYFFLTAILHFTFYLTALKAVNFENSKYKLQSSKCFIFTE